MEERLAACSLDSPSHPSLTFLSSILFRSSPPTSPSSRHPSLLPLSLPTFHQRESLALFPIVRRAPTKPHTMATQRTASTVKPQATEAVTDMEHTKEETFIVPGFTVKQLLGAIP